MLAFVNSVMTLVSAKGGFYSRFHCVIRKYLLRHTHVLVLCRPRSNLTLYEHDG
jgi:hypothetical protein